VLLYWAENVVIGIINVFRMAVTKEDLGTGDPRTDEALRVAIAADPERWETAHKRVRRDRKITMIPFFILHYGVFCSVHLFFLSSIFNPIDDLPPFVSVFGYDLAPVLIGIVPIALSHLYSFFTNFIGKGEYLRMTPKQVMHQPYGRVVVLHVAILAGGALVQHLGGTVWMLVVLVLAKTAMDAGLHVLERDKFKRAG